MFTRSPCEALGVDPNFFCHRLYVDPRCPLKKQRPYRSSNVYAKVVKEEIDRLKEAGAINEVFLS